MSVCALARGGFEQELVPRAVLKEASMQTRTGWPKQRRQAKTAVGIWRWVRWRKNVRGGRTLRVCQRTGEGETKRATDGTNRRQTDDGQTEGRLDLCSEWQAGQGHELRGSCDLRPTGVGCGAGFPENSSLERNGDSDGETDGRSGNGRGNRTVSFNGFSLRPQAVKEMTKSNLKEPEGRSLSYKLNMDEHTDDHTQTDCRRKKDKREKRDAQTTGGHAKRQIGARFPFGEDRDRASPGENTETPGRGQQTQEMFGTKRSERA